jgi:hypothetical protein
VAARLPRAGGRRLVVRRRGRAAPGHPAPAGPPGDLRALLLAALARAVVWLRRLLAALPWSAARRPAWQVA